MNENEKIEILKAREYIVAKSNQLVQKSRYDFSVFEQRTIAYICSMIKPIEAVERAKESPFQLEYEFDILEYARICGVKNTGEWYNDVKATLKKLRDKSMWLELPDGTETTICWIDKVWTNKRSGKAKIRLDNDMMPYLFDLQQKFLSYGLINVLNMKSQYSIRLYELLKSIHDQKSAQTDKRSKAEKQKTPKKVSWTADLDELKRLLMVDNLKSYSDFDKLRRKVLEVSKKEINELTDITIDYEPIRKGRKVVKLEFSIVAKNSFDKLIAFETNNELLGELK